MNERIQKIANESFQYASEQSGLFTSKFMEHYDQKFAELIVQECLTFVRPNSYFQAYPDNMIGGEDGVRLLETITNQIEEHFGVE